MNLFVCLVHPNGGQISQAERARFATSRCCHGLTSRWCQVGSAAVLTAGDGLGAETAVARWGSWVGVGIVRLDNGAEVSRWLGGDVRGSSDMDLVLRSIAEQGERRIADLLGDFAFVAWDEATQALILARDAFGVKKLYYADHSDLLAVASRAEILASAEQYDLQPLLELASVSVPAPDRTPYADVRAVPSGSVASLHRGRLAIREYWSPERFEPTEVLPHKAHRCYDVFRELFAEAVRLRLTGAPDTWAQLSGGLDSSSVVSMAQWLVQHGRAPSGVTGTLSWVYRWSTDGDERRYSNAVADYYRVPNEVLIDDWWWQEDELGPPLTDAPGPEYPLYGRERRTRSLIRAAGGRVLLTGVGSDQYLLGNMFFFADWLAQGRVWEALQEMLRRAALGRVSFWNLAFQNAVLPLLPARVQRILVPGTSLPPWIVPHVAKRFGLDQTADGRSYGGRWGRKYRGVVAENMRAVSFTLGRHDIVEEALDVRHPFLYRPLVEYGLRLRPEMCVQPNARKWVLREAMRGILPEAVRTRVGKGGNHGCILQSLVHERRKLERMLADPILAQLGCVDAKKLRTAFASGIQSGSEKLVVALMYTLAVETWLQARSGRWIAADSRRSTTRRTRTVNN